jgi:hypothetical protein
MLRLILRCSVSSLKISSDAQNASASPTKEVRRSLHATGHATGHAFVPIGNDCPLVIVADRCNPFSQDDVRQQIGIGNIDSVFEEGVPEGKAHGLSSLHIHRVSGMNPGKGRQGGRGKSFRIESLEEIRGHLPSQLLNMVGGGPRIERYLVDKFQRPGSYAEGSVLMVQLGSPLNHATDADMCKRAPDVGEYFDGLHVSNLRRSDQCDRPRSCPEHSTSSAVINALPPAPVRPARDPPTAIPRTMKKSMFTVAPTEQ